MYVYVCNSGWVRSEKKNYLTQDPTQTDKIFKKFNPTQLLLFGLGSSGCRFL